MQILHIYLKEDIFQLLIGLIQVIVYNDKVKDSWFIAWVTIIYRKNN